MENFWLENKKWITVFRNELAYTLINTHEKIIFGVGLGFLPLLIRSYVAIIGAESEHKISKADVCFKMHSKNAI